MDKKFSIVLLFLLCSLSLNCFSDGGLLVVTRFDDSLKLLAETDQECSIDYNGGFEDMVISVGADLQNEEAVWIFPIPAKPGDAEIRIVKTFPDRNGHNIRSIVKRAVDDASWPMYMSQVWPLSAGFFGAFGVFNVGQGNLVVGGGFEGVDIYGHEESLGLTTELVAADNPESLTSYLRSKGMNISSGALPVFGEYIGQGYSFAVSWVSDEAAYTEASTESSLSVGVKFKTDKMYYPLKPTSIYGRATIPATLYITGYVLPDVYDGIKQYTETDYYLSNDGSKYTRISINAPAAAYTDDLWIDGTAPLDVTVLGFAASNTLIAVLVLFLFYSVAASLLAGKIVFGKKVTSKNLIQFGLANLLSFLGFAAFVFSSIKKEAVDDCERVSKPRSSKSVLIVSFLFSFGLIFLFSAIGWPLLASALFGIIILIGLTGPVLLICLASEGKRGAYLASFSVAFIVLAVSFNTIISTALSDPPKPGGMISHGSGPGFVKMQPLTPSIAYRGGNFTASFTNALGTTVKIVRLGMIEGVSGKKCRIKQLENKTIKAGGMFTLIAACPEKEDGEPYEIGVEITYNATMGGITTTHIDRGAIRGFGEWY